MSLSNVNVPSLESFWLTLATSKTLRDLQLPAQSTVDVEVVLVTQCSFGRLKKMEAQLSCWTGKASIAIHLKPGEDRSKAERAILTSIENARNCAEKKQSGRCDTLMLL